MATSLTPSFSDLPEGEPIPPHLLAYFQQKLRNTFHQLVLREWVNREKAGLSRKDLARRIGKKPEQITRWLGTPSNWTLDTLSDLMLGMGIEPTIGARPLLQSPGITLAPEEPTFRAFPIHGDPWTSKPLQDVGASWPTTVPKTHFTIRVESDPQSNMRFQYPDRGIQGDNPRIREDLRSLAALTEMRQ